MKATTTTTTDRKQTFTDLLREYERQATTRTNEKDYTKALTDIATAVVYSVLKKCIETSQNKALIQVKRDIAKDIALLNNIKYAQENAYEYRYNKDGEQVPVVKDKDLHNALTKLYKQSLGDGLDLVNDAIVTIMQETEKARDRNGGELPLEFMEEIYNTRRLKRKVWIKVEESVNGWEDKPTTAIQEVYKSVRRCIEQSRAVQTDAKNGYTYIEDLAKDEKSNNEEIIYRRLPKYADIGGAVKDFNGKETAYTADKQTADDIEILIEKLNLSKQQAEILKLKLSGYGYKAIATYFGVKGANIQTQLKRIREKAVKIGLQPKTV